MDRLEEEQRQLKGMVTKLRVDTATEVETLRIDLTQKLSVVEAKADQTTKLQERTLSAIQELQSRSTPTPANPAMQPSSVFQAQPASTAPYGQGWAAQKRGWKGAKGSWKGGPKGNLLTRICYGCGQRGHIVRNCPVVNGSQSGPLQRPVTAIARDLLASVNAYVQGGVECMPVRDRKSDV